ncbi:MAG: alpha/beta hydrolase [Solirubrobacterales bacterium]|nr:alpha/beta hydrolase [Solirubrobacterales bacterium]
MNGDKENRITDKAKLFTDAGYLFASVNYRLSPDISSGSPDFDADRVRFPNHPDDVARAVAWIADHAEAYGGDPDSILLIGHSAGAHLVSLVGTNPEFMKRVGVAPNQVIGVVSLDTATFDISEDATPDGSIPGQRALLLWNAFGTPAEEAANPGWNAASPLLHAGLNDPRHLFVTQAAKANRIEANREMAAALGQDPDGVVTVPLDHAGINAAVGAPGDPSGESAAILEFMGQRVAAHPPLRVSIRKRPGKRVRIGRKARKRRVAFRFRANRKPGRLKCRIDSRKFKRCHSPEHYRLRRGRHVFRVHAVYPSGRTSPERKVRFRIVAGIAADAEVRP